LCIDNKTVVLKHVSAHLVKKTALYVEQITAPETLEVVMIFTIVTACKLVTAYPCIIRHKTAHYTLINKPFEPAVERGFAKLFTTLCKLKLNFGSGKMAMHIIIKKSQQHFTLFCIILRHLIISKKKSAI